MNADVSKAHVLLGYEPTCMGFVSPESFVSLEV